MKTNSNNKIFEDWLQYKENPAANKSLEKQFSGDDLDYLASKGFEKAGINLNDVKQIAAGAQHTLALCNDGTVWAWGSNKNGQLGVKEITYSRKPVKVVGLNNVVKIGYKSSSSTSFGGYAYTT